VTVADLRSLELERPRSLAELCERLAERASGDLPSVLLAGGTDWMVEQEMRAPFGAVDLPKVFDVSRLEELRGIELGATARGDVLRIGAATTYLELRRSEAVRRRAPVLERASADIGAVQIQARGTLGGNLATASPAGDGVAALAAYDAIVVVRSVRGERRIPFPELYTGYKQSTRLADEVIVAVELPLPREGSSWVWRKVGTRRAQSISKVALAAIAELDGDQLTRVGLGMASVAPTTSLLLRTRELLLSTPLSKVRVDDLEKAVLADVSPIDDVRSTRRYRAHVACAVVRDWVRSFGAKV
jgi:CO/xanthine dehydrogenase FAD-binding subunit